MKRQPDALTDGTFDLLILGGGITGAGAALDAALRGFRTALIDKGDFASGTSSASSKLIHGGLRYLEHGDFSLVYEALHERRRLLKNAPHLVRPLRFVLPFYQGSRLPSWKCRLGLVFYDLLAGRGNIRRSRPQSWTGVRRDFPGLKVEGLFGGTEYWDAQMDDARLCIEVLRTTSEQGACLCNYVEAKAFEQCDGKITGVHAVDHLSGKELTIRARLVVNATGPWLDHVRRLAGDASESYLQPTKGAHLVVANPGLTAALLLLHPADGRVFFVIPWMSKLLIGTTDTLSAEPPDHLRVLPEEVSYLLEAYNHYFAPPLAEADVIGTFAGLRPLIRARPGEPSSLSREFRLFWSPEGLLSVGGGKYTTYRRMAEIAVDAVEKRLGRRKRKRTADFPMDGTPAGPWEEFARTEPPKLCGRHGLSEASARHLVNRYGRRAADVAGYLAHDPALAEPIVAGEPDLWVEFAYQRDHEMAVRPADFLLRRTHLGLFRPELLRILPFPARS